MTAVSYCLGVPWFEDKLTFFADGEYNELQLDLAENAMVVQITRIRRASDLAAVVATPEWVKKERKKERNPLQKRCFEDIISPVGCNSPISLTPKKVDTRRYPAEGGLSQAVEEAQHRIRAESS